MNIRANCSEGFLRINAPAKVNLHLEVLGLRQDGFHELAMVMQSIDLADQIDIRNTKNSEIIISSNHSDLSIGEDNLIMKAAKLIRSSSGKEELGASIHLVKNIPIGAGLAGGSADGAATLIGLNSLWDLNYSLKELEKMSAKLGSDVPFCISGGVQLCFGRGETLEPLDDSIGSMALVLVKDPLTEVSTPWAYEKYKEINSNKYLKNEDSFAKRCNLLRSSVWLTSGDQSTPPLRNDLQEVVAPVIPSVEKALSFLSCLNGAISFAMSGSGPSCFALFPSLDSAKTALENNKKKLTQYGLNGWCCSFQTKRTHSIKWLNKEEIYPSQLYS